MSNELVRLQPQEFSREEVDVIKNTIAPQGTTEAELGLFLQVCKKTGLDPFSRQIYFSEKKSQVNGQWVSKKTPETTIDGFRVIAERSGVYGGQRGPFWCGADGAWKDVWLSPEFPSAAKVGIIRKDFDEPLWGVALFAEYAQKTRDGHVNSMWSKMAANQLAKCAEALGLRKAFPRDLSGMYSREEMAQAQPVAGDDSAAPGSPYTPEQQEVIDRKMADAKSSPVATAAEGRQAQRSPRTEPATASVQSGGPAETSPGMSGPAPAEGDTPAQRAPSDPYAPPRTTVGGKVADAPVSAPASYKNEQQRKAEPLQIPEELLPLFNNMSTSTGMVNARKMIIDECAKVYGPEAAEADWMRIGAKHRVLGVGKKIVGDVQRALLELWAIKEYMEKKLERDAREAPPLKNVNEFQASEDDIPAVIGAPVDEVAQQPLLEMTKEDPRYASD